MNFSLPLDHEAIKKFLPHRYPFLLVDRVVALESGSHIQGYKNISANEELFNGHFPHKAILPGVMICEALAQISAILGFATSNRQADQGYLYLFACLDNVKFKKQVLPGDRLDLSAQLLSVRRGFYKFSCQASVDGQVATLADITCVEQKVTE